MPLDKGGGSLTIGYGSGGSPPLLIPSSDDSERLAFLKISLFSRPLNPSSDVLSFRSADHLPDDFKGPWATITKKVVHPPKTPGPCPDFQQPTSEFVIGKPTGRIFVSNKINANIFNQHLIHHPFQKPSRSIAPYDLYSKGVDNDLPPPISERPARSRLAIFWDKLAMRLRLGVRRLKPSKTS